MVHVSYWSILLVMGMSTFNRPYNIWDSFIMFISNGFDPSNIIPHGVCRMPLVPHPSIERPWFYVRGWLMYIHHKFGDQIPRQSIKGYWFSFTKLDILSFSTQPISSGGDSWHSSILISGSSFIFTDEMNHFRYYLRRRFLVSRFCKYQALVVLNNYSLI